jgi:hypothetical protein
VHQRVGVLGPWGTLGEAALALSIEQTNGCILTRSVGGGERHFRSQANSSIDSVGARKCGGHGTRQRSADEKSMMVRENGIIRRGAELGQWNATTPLCLGSIRQRG